MCVTQRLCAVFVLTVGATCIGCDQSSAEATPKQVPPPIEQPTPKAKSEEAPPKPLAEVTPRAAKRVREIVQSAAIDGNWALRLQASWPKGICSPQHKLDLETNLSSSSDSVFESEGIRVIVLKRQIEMFRGAKIDFGEKDGKQGFLVNNPNFEGDLLKKWGPIVAADPLSARK